jgi:hypothetical protein
MFGLRQPHPDALPGEAGWQTHNRRCSESVDHLIESYAPRIGMRVVSRDGQDNYWLDNPNQEGHSHLITKRAAAILAGDFFGYDMVGAELEYRTWEDKLQVASENPFC